MNMKNSKTIAEFGTVLPSTLMLVATICVLRLVPMDGEGAKVLM